MPRQVSTRVHTWAARGTWPLGCTLGPMGSVAKRAWVAENLASWPLACRGSMVWVQQCCYNLSHVLAPHC